MTDLLLPAADCPGILDGWCGPVVVDDAVEWTWGLLPERVHGTYVVTRWNGTVLAIESDIRLDLARAECRDRVCRHRFNHIGPVRLVAREVPLVARPRPADDSHWDRRLVLFIGEMCLDQFGAVLAGLDPNDPRTLPDSSRWVDARALLLAAQPLREAT